MSFPGDVTYTATHEWLRRDDGGVTVGISDHAQSELTDIVFVELPEVGRHFETGEEMCTLESVKAVAYIYAPVAGTIVTVNANLRAHPELINQDPYGDGWIVRITSDEPERSVRLLDASTYQQTLESAG